MLRRDLFKTLAALPLSLLGLVKASRGQRAKPSTEAEDDPRPAQTAVTWLSPDGRPIDPRTHATISGSQHFVR